MKQILNETTLFGEVNRVKVAIERIQNFAVQAQQNHPKGFAVCDSGGKDSGVIKQLAYMSGVPFEIISNHTTADHALTVRFVRAERDRWRALGIDYTITFPTYKGQPTSMWALIPLKGPPLRIKRWCCDILKERSTQGRFSITGVRWSESSRRKNNRATFELPKNSRERIMLNNDNDARRKLTEICMRKNQVVVNPIIDWSDADVWEFHEKFHLPHNPLYDMGFKRVGCVGCPMADIKHELELFPEYKKLYLRAFQKCVESKPLSRYGWRTGQDLYNWWVSSKSVQFNEDQLTLFDELYGGDDPDDF